MGMESKRKIDLRLFVNGGRDFVCRFLKVGILMECCFDYGQVSPVIPCTKGGRPEERRRPGGRRESKHLGLILFIFFIIFSIESLHFGITEFPMVSN
jgi:hypothetical protein